MSDADPYGIDIQACRDRQHRLLEMMQVRDLDAVVLCQNQHVQWIAGPRYAWTFQPAAMLDATGKLTLVAPNEAPELAAADEIATYPAQWHSTLRNDQRSACCAALGSVVDAASLHRVGCEGSTFPRELETWSVEWLDCEPDLYRLRRRKHPDELARIRKAIAGTRRMYECAREIIRPGIEELEVFNALQSAAVEELGEMLTGTGNDYQCGARGGPPRSGRAAAAGELYILDLGPAFRGYFADNARTIAVTEPSDVQLRAWETIMPVFQHIEDTVRPGKRAKELFEEVRQMLDQASLGVFNHHLGHGIGLFPHEAPHLNPHWDDVFEVGDVFTAEPGLYAPELREGMRLENDYLVTEEGVELLTDFPIELR